MAINEGLEEISKKGEEREKEIEMAKFHEERGKVKCECWQCQESKLIEKEVKAKVKKEATDYEKEEKKADKQQCPECKKWVKKLDEENGVCKSCLSNYE
jgi:Zn finger protein HypA/HybF involved in hydrogenase expression